MGNLSSLENSRGSISAQKVPRVNNDVNTVIMKHGSKASDGATVEKTSESTPKNKTKPASLKENVNADCTVLSDDDKKRLLVTNKCSKLAYQMMRYVRK